MITGHDNPLQLIVRLGRFFFFLGGVGGIFCLFRSQHAKQYISCFCLGIYAMIDLYGQCVQISIYDEDYQGIQPVEVPTERTVVETILTTEETIEGRSPGMLVKSENISFKIL